ncbi:MAG: FG-GAP-like repeat-containing protein, partial [Bacteroidota bacterium]
MRKCGIFLGVLYLMLTSVCAQEFVSESFPVFHGEKELRSPFAGGLNEPQFSPIHLDGDSLIDLVIFDRSGQVILPFVQADNAYLFAPQFQQAFPPVHNFVLVRDLNGDGLGDVFAHNPEGEGIQVFLNTSTPSMLEFRLEISLLMTTDGIPIFIPATDVPGIVDIDGDGDLDIMAFDALGSYVNLFENISNSDPSNQEGNFVLADPCWGSFREDGLSNEVFLNDPCTGLQGGVRNELHVGSTLTPIPQDGGVLSDLVLGDISHENLVYLRNTGTVEEAFVSDFSPDFPMGSTAVDLHFFPAAFLLDVTFDQVPDLVVAPNASIISDNFQNVWLYTGSSESDGAAFSLTQKDFIQEEMIDCGANSHPILFDYNGDGLLDILVGNKAYQNGGEIPSASFTLYENIGTPSSPSFKLASRNYLNIGSFFTQIIQEIRPTFGDLDGDGDQDLVIGDINGQLHLFTNTPIEGEASFNLSEFRFSNIDIGQNASPQLFDINGDNLLDLIVGEGNGTLNYFQNVGSAGIPVFDAEPTQANWGGIDISPECCTGFSVPFVFQNRSGLLSVLVGSESGEFYLFDQTRSNPEARFILNPSFPSNLGIGARTSPWGADLDGDGSLEWIVGNARGGIGIFHVPGLITVSRENTIQENQIRLIPNPSPTQDIYLSIPPGSPLPLAI